MLKAGHGAQTALGAGRDEESDPTSGMESLDELTYRVLGTLHLTSTWGTEGLGAGSGLD